MSRVMSISFFLVILTIFLATVSMGDREVQERRVKACAPFKVFSYIERVCGPVAHCSYVDDRDIATILCSRGMTASEIREVCCPQ